MIKSYTEETITIDGHKIEVLDNHQLNGDVLFVFHGNSGSALSAKNLYTTGLGSEYRIISCSLLGHGKSDMALDPATWYSIAGLGKQIKKIVNHYQLSKYYLLGQSISSHAILEAHDTFDNCKGLIAISSPPINLNTLPQAFLQSPVSALLFKGELTDEEIKILSNGFTIDNQNLNSIATDIKRTDPLFRTNLGESIFSGNIGDELSCYNELGFPVLFVKTSDDSFLSDDYYELLIKDFNISMNIVSIDNSGHLILLDNTIQCADAIRNFIKSIVK